MTQLRTTQRTNPSMRRAIAISNGRTALHAALASGLLFGAAIAFVAPAKAQQPGAPSWQSQPPRPTQPPSGQTRAKQPAKQAESSGGSEASLRQRVEQLEEQLVDLQVVVGTVESLSRGGGAATTSAAFRGGVPSPSGGGSGADAGRIAALETQVQALTAQLEQMSQQMRQMQQGGALPPRGPSGPAPRVGGPPPVGGGFSTTTVTAANDPIANIINAPDQQPGAAQRPAPPGGPSLTSSPMARQQYDQAYSQLLQQNYPAAEAGFSDFLARYPNDELTANAQFWLGETHFVRSQWDNAAAAFLKVAQSHPRSDKAPDSLAKFAMSMERKGNKTAACRALQELRSRYPNPPAHVRTWETAERRRAGCS